MRNSFSLNQNNNVVDVLFSFSGRDQYARPTVLTWKDEEYRLGGVQFWYAESHGPVRVHHYRVSDIDGNYTFELSLETENLTWQLKKAQKTSTTRLNAGRNFVGVSS